MLAHTSALPCASPATMDLDDHPHEAASHGVRGIALAERCSGTPISRGLGDIEPVVPTALCLQLLSEQHQNSAS